MVVHLDLFWPFAVRRRKLPRFSWRVMDRLFLTVNILRLFDLQTNLCNAKHYGKHFILAMPISDICWQIQEHFVTQCLYAYTIWDLLYLSARMSPYLSLFLSFHLLFILSFLVFCNWLYVYASNSVFLYLSVYYLWFNCYSSDLWNNLWAC